MAEIVHSYTVTLNKIRRWLRLEAEVSFLVVNGQRNLPEKKLPSASQQQTFLPALQPT